MNYNLFITLILNFTIVFWIINIKEKKQLKWLIFFSILKDCLKWSCQWPLDLWHEWVYHYSPIVELGAPFNLKRIQISKNKCSLKKMRWPNFHGSSKRWFFTLNVKNLDSLLSSMLFGGLLNIIYIVSYQQFILCFIEKYMNHKILEFSFIPDQFTSSFSFEICKFIVCIK